MEMSMMQYPEHEQNRFYPPLGYLSQMVDMALTRDDVEGYFHFLDKCGGLSCKTILADSLPYYAAKRKAVKCLDALIEKGVHSHYYSDQYLREFAARAES